MSREDDAYKDGKRAALRGELVSMHVGAYKHSKALWTRFQLGYYDGLKEIARAKKEGKDEKGI